jgi:6-pyruvoyltetrahydropterin/6-carboxytetrahydropterin synthase
MPTVLISRRFDFSSSHRYYRDEWSQEENERVFGLCALPNGHGHNYTLEVGVAGEPDPVTGMVVNLVDLKDAVDGVLEAFDHRHLNLDTPHFAETIPTTENLAVVLWGLIEASLAQVPGTCTLARLRLYETDDLYVEFFGQYAQESPA